MFYIFSLSGNLLYFLGERVRKRLTRSCNGEKEGRKGDKGRKEKMGGKGAKVRDVEGEIVE